MPARANTGDEGQASVELIAMLPVIALVAALAWQAVVAGQALWLGGAAARAAARAAAVGADPAHAARQALPASLEPGLRVRRGEGGRVDVSVRVPAVAGAWHLGTLSRTARFAPQGP